VFIVKFPVIFAVVYVATSLVNKDEHIICYAYTSVQGVSFTYDSLERTLISFCFYLGSRVRVGNR